MAAPTGNPVIRQTGIPAPNGYGFGKPVAKGRDGEVIVYQPTRSDGGLKVPITITNNGKDRAFYKVSVRVTGPSGFSTTVHVETSTTGVYPGVTWPTELIARDSDHPVPDKASAEIADITKSSR
ncbi:hypothetical protein [Streptomyces eurocidicus]|uniref:Uncharacterized protein n=1 Tax=Streptomyces eurocidicus TaxID=66423 RepID=A0A7W8B734_STREU|nr:hypothetical protein [Streptomyces eurocidicus]MBB5117981.1 hypothetical protein [Streptomyces eurocidicus]MBF6053960.1 hypothetical protein [Streptomyces eurocidicus]